VPISPRLEAVTLYVECCARMNGCAVSTGPPRCDQHPRAHPRLRLQTGL